MKPSIELKSVNSFGINACAHELHRADSVSVLCNLWRQAIAKQYPVLLLGSGSNVLFTDNFHGSVILNRIKGIDIQETADSWHVYAGAGENWHQFIEFLLNKSIYGLENLALIPGCVGSAPIQNIGAYGMELKNVCEYVDIVQLDSGEVSRLSAIECQFGYRDSIFKHQYRDNFAITGVGFKLSKIWEPILAYGDLSQLDRTTITPQEVFNTICATRRSKLPDPEQLGNAGSFFKNPIVSATIAENIRQDFSNCPQFPQANGNVKLAAGWLIDMCGLKGYQLGGAAVHIRQALVLINQDSATGMDIVNLAATIRQKVFQRFSVLLEPEVRFIGTNGEIDSVECIS